MERWGMPFCVRCGREILVGVAFCPSCGAPVTPITEPAIPKAESLIDVDLQINARSFFLDPDPRVISKPENLMRGLELFLQKFEPDYVLVTGSDAYWLFQQVSSAKERITQLYELHGPLVPYADEKDPSWAFRDRIKSNPDKKQMLVSGTDPSQVAESLFPELAKPHKAAVILVGLSRDNNMGKFRLYSKAFDSLPRDYGYFLWIIDLALITTGEQEQLSKISDPAQRVNMVLDIISTI